MQTDTMIHVQPSIYTLNKNDIGELLGRLQLQPSAGSPLQTVDDSSGSMVLPAAEAEVLLKDVVFADAMKVMAAPQQVFRVYAGGGMQPRGDLFMCIHAGVKETPIVAVTPSVENSWVVLAFPEKVQGIAWLLDTIAVKIEEAPQSPFPETFTPEFLIYVLGAIDQYRRCSYENMLNHRTDEKFSFSLATYAANIEKELKSGDLRWLLPAFAALTPGFNELNLTEDKMVYEQLIDADVMLPVSSGEAGFLFGFGEVGKDLGTEFFRTWVQSAGIEVNNITTEGMNLQHRAFVAGTMLANHFFEILPAAETRNRIRYAPLNRNALGELLEAWATPLPEKIVPVETIKQEEKAPALVTEVTTAETITGVTAAETVAKATTIETITDATAAAETSNCTTCGSVVLPGAHFCPKCGTILAPKKTVVPVQKFCSQCGQPVNEKNRFCSKCGKPIS